MKIFEAAGRLFTDKDVAQAYYDLMEIAGREVQERTVYEELSDMLKSHRAQEKLKTIEEDYGRNKELLGRFGHLPTKGDGPAQT